MTQSKLLKSTLIVAISSIGIASTAAIANAGFSVGDSLGSDEAQITQSLETAGATIDEIELEDNMIEVEFMMDGQEYEAEVDPATGQIVEIAMEDESDEDDDDEDDDTDENDEDDKDDDDKADMNN